MAGFKIKLDMKQMLISTQTAAVVQCRWLQVSTKESRLAYFAPAGICRNYTNPGKTANTTLSSTGRDFPSTCWQKPCNVSSHLWGLSESIVGSMSTLWHGFTIFYHCFLPKALRLMTSFSHTSFVNNHRIAAIQLEVRERTEKWPASDPDHQDSPMTSFREFKQFVDKG